MRALLLTLLLLVSCTPAQRDWRNNLYLDVSAGGTQDPKATTASTGVSYPLVWNVWGTMGVWTDINGNTGPYWGMSYSWAPFAKKSVSGPPARRNQ